MDECVRAFLVNEKKLTLGKLLGNGGFGEVHEVWTDSGIPLALKVPHNRLEPHDPESQELLKKELKRLQLMKAIRGHPHLINLIEFWNVFGYLVTLWELATDGTLEDLLLRFQASQARAIPPRTLIPLMYEAAQGIDYLNERGIYHRDIKPSNLFLCQGHVKIGDLGLIKCVGVSTGNHSVQGSFGYTPLEALEGGRLAPTVDLYGLAATYVKLRTGKEPFGTPPNVFERQSKGWYCTEGLTGVEMTLLTQALHPDPAQRPKNGARQWVRDLYNALVAAASPSAGTTKTGQTGQGNSGAAPRASGKQTASARQFQERESFHQGYDQGQAAPAGSAVATAAMESSSDDDWWWSLLIGAAVGAAGYFLFGKFFNWK